MKGGPEWVKASSEAMAFDKTQGLQKFIKRGTTKAEGEKNRPTGKAAKTAMEVDMAEATTSARDTTATTLRKASTVTAAASKAVSKIKEPKRRAEAQNLLDGMRKSETNLLKAQRQGKDQERPLDEQTRSGEAAGGAMTRYTVNRTVASFTAITGTTVFCHCMSAVISCW